MATTVSGGQYPDNDPTDELPVLSEVALAEYEAESGKSIAANDETGEYTLKFPSPPPRAGARRGAGGDTDELLQSLEHDVAELANRWDRLESQLTDNAATIGTLTEQLAATQRSLSESTTSERELNRRLDEKDEQLTQLRDQTGQLRRENALLRERIEGLAADKAAVESSLKAARQGSDLETELKAQIEQRRTLEIELDQNRSHAAELEAELAAARQLIDELNAAAGAAQRGATADVDAYRSEVAALSNYIANRRSHWDDMEAQVKGQNERIRELEAEVEHRSERQQAAELTAQRETERAAELKARLSTLAERLEAAQSTAAAADEAAKNHASESAAAAGKLGKLRNELQRARAQLETRKRQLSDKEQYVSAARERNEELGKQLSQTREELEKTGQELARTREELTKTLEELGGSRAKLHGLEEQLARNDHEADEREERIAALQRELGEQLNGLRSLQSERDAEGGAEQRATLVCLTSEQPQEYVIAKPVTTIGRSGQCDIQIATDFVSREHARLLASQEGVSIEDMGSTNGVFVNSVRIEQQPLHHGDWVTIGETQFRFLNDAHG